MGDDGTSEPIPGEPHAPPDLELTSTRPSFFQRYGLPDSWRYGSANLLLLLGSASILVGGWAPWLVLAVAMLLGSFADEVSGDDRTALNDGCLFCKINLYLSLPFVCILALAIIRSAATQPSITEHPFQLIGVLWLAGYLFALVGATVAHELCHRTSRTCENLGVHVARIHRQRVVHNLSPLRPSPAGGDL